MATKEYQCHLERVEILFYISIERRKKIVAPLHVRGVPELVVEIGSPGTRKRDETIKLRLYERTGVLQYWCVDTRADFVRVHRRDGDRCGGPFDLSRASADVLTASLLPGLEMPLDRVFPE